ncbi:conserved hypothetical protein [Agrobacterium fabrum str. J-07]|nr:conserved hypothetical protein [Agrobacterium fabrum str. J-07]
MVMHGPPVSVGDMATTTALQALHPTGTPRHEQHVLRHHYPTKSIQAQILLDLRDDTSQPRPVRGKGNRWWVLF